MSDVTDRHFDIYEAGPSARFFEVFRRTERWPFQDDSRSPGDGGRAACPVRARPGSAVGPPGRSSCSRTRNSIRNGGANSPFLRAASCRRSRRRSTRFNRPRKWETCSGRRLPARRDSRYAYAERPLRRRSRAACAIGSIFGTALTPTPEWRQSRLTGASRLGPMGRLAAVVQLRACRNEAHADDLCERGTATRLAAPRAAALPHDDWLQSPRTGGGGAGNRLAASRSRQSSPPERCCRLRPARWPPKPLVPASSTSTRARRSARSRSSVPRVNCCIFAPST